MQNCPTPRVMDPAMPSPISRERSFAAAGVTTRGFADPSSPKKGIGAARALARAHSERPAGTDPVKPTALIAGASTRATPASNPKTSAKRPSGAERGVRRAFQRRERGEARLGVGGVSLDHDGTARREGRRGVTARYRKRKRKIGAAKDGDGTERYTHAT